MDGLHPRLICVGDMMMEWIADRPMLFDAKKTMVLDSRIIDVGGAVCNLAWYFTALGHASTIVSHCGLQDRARIENILRDRGTGAFDLISKRDMTDLLITLPGAEFPAVYMAGYLAEDEAAALSKKIPDACVVTFCGSRHAHLRQTLLHRLVACSDVQLIFSPSYTIYTFSRVELESYLKLAHLLILNGDEAAYLNDRLGSIGLDRLMRRPRMGGIITSGSRGACLFPREKAMIEVASISHLDADVIGAGDAFLCGFMHGFWESDDWRYAGIQGNAVAAQVVRQRDVRSKIVRAILPKTF